MDKALNWANDIDALPELPLSLKDILVRTELILELDKPFLPRALHDDYFGELTIDRKNQCIDQIAQISKKYIYDVKDERNRANICLRLWAGCLAGAKIIALETIDGPNTPEYRNLANNLIMKIAQNNPIFRAGIKTAVEFKRSRNEKYSFEGIPENSFLRS